MKQQRPRTGFKQRNVNENVQYEEIMKYADLLYEEKYDYNSERERKSI